jgi:aspartate aminotransferase-like enzyme/predicted N-acetyltransferase YhbS
MTRPTPQAVATPIRPAAAPAVDRFAVKIADQDNEFEQIHRLNYETFVEELGQHAANADGRLVDEHHGRNIYFIAKQDRTVVGMICLTPFDGVRFSIEKRLTDPHVIDEYRAQAVEIRLLAVRKEIRATAVFARLAHDLAVYAIARGYRYGLISGVTTHVPLYRRFGFQALDGPVTSGQARFVPMVVSLERFLAYARQSRSVAGCQGGEAFGAERTPVLLTPGPVSVHPAVIDAMSKSAAGLHHRSSDFVDLVAEIEASLRRLFHVPRDYAIAMLGASGTGGVEAMLRLAGAFTRPRALILSNGVFGDRLRQIAESVGLGYHFHRFAAHTRLDLDQTRRVLASDPEIGSVAIVHMETSLGQLNDLNELEDLCRERDVKLLVDMVSSLGGEHFDFRTMSPSVAVSVSGKALAAFPGVALVFVREDTLDSLQHGRQSHYLDIARHVRGWSEQRSVPFTLPVTLFPPLRQALAEIEREGVARKIARHERALKLLEDWLTGCGFTLVPVLSPSSTTRTFAYTEEQDEKFDRLTQRTRSRGYAWYQNAHYHRPARQFQVSTMGWIGTEAIEALVDGMARRKR